MTGPRPALRLPTDTAATRLDTRQYELLGRRLGSGVPRRTLLVAAGFALPWMVLLLVCGVPLLSRLGPAMYILPPFVLTYRGLLRDPSGRISLMRWYDRVLARFPGRCRPICNPLLPAAVYSKRPAIGVYAVAVILPGEG